jgi:hypothetical protein
MDGGVGKDLPGKTGPPVSWRQGNFSLPPPPDSQLLTEAKPKLGVYIALFGLGA